MTAKSRPVYAPHPVALYGCRVSAALVTALGAVAYIPMKEGILPVSLLYAWIPLFIAVNALPYLLYLRIPRISDGRRHILSPSHSRHSLRACAHGVETLHFFLLAVGISV